MENVTDINQIKMAVLKKTAEYAYKGVLLEKVDEIPFELIDGPKPRFRCCVYREREIIRQRVRLSMGRIPTGSHYSVNDGTQVVHVISAACEGCPIARFTVTDNCHNCLARKCIKACKFGAISRTERGAYIDKTKCKKCGQCVLACPYGAIVDIQRPCIKACPVDAITIDENDLAMIDESKCINCGKCVVGCPFGAVSDVSMISNVIDTIIKGESDVYAMVAPAIEGQFGDVPVSVLKAAIKDLGFSEVIEVALGADAVSVSETDEVVSRAKEGKQTTTSCCPAFVNFIEKHFPTLKDNISTTVSPMVAAARFIKAANPNATIVFIGPCIAKKNEALKHYIGEINYVLTFEELYAMFEVKEIDFSNYSDIAETATKYGKGFAKSGGVTNAVMQVVKEREYDIDLKTMKCSGIEECKKALMMLKSGKLPVDFIEGMACENGCVNGPAKVNDFIAGRRVFDKYADNKNEDVIKTVNDNKLNELNIHRH